MDAPEPGATSPYLVAKLNLGLEPPGATQAGGDEVGWDAHVTDAGQDWNITANSVSPLPPTYGQRQDLLLQHLLEHLVSVGRVRRLTASSG